jgi:formate hydrogenlyase subunit 4
LALLAGSIQLSAIVEFLLRESVGLRVSLVLALVALLMVAIAENARIPVDNPTTHLELAMVHEAMVLEYSGRHLALIEAAAVLKLVAYLSLVACLFFPFGMIPAGFSALLYPFGILAWLAKMAVLGAALAVFETAIAKMRVFRVPEFLGGALVPGFLGTPLLFVSRVL